jgi:hypothetical protein
MVSMPVQGIGPSLQKARFLSTEVLGAITPSMTRPVNGVATVCVGY